jgi:hypothetical protein
MSAARKSMGGHESPVMGTDTWLTPVELIQALGKFDLDPCTPEYMPWKTAESRYFKPATDGLKATWFGRIWLNPPYGREAAKWLAKLADHGRGTALIFARTETEMFFSTVWGKATAILFLKGRLHFHLPDGQRAPGNAGAPSCLVAYGVDDAEALKNSGIEGQYIYLGYGDLI